MSRDTRKDLLLDGRYRLVKQLGAGGFGCVWQARDERLRVDVAIKELWLPQRKGSPEHRMALTRAMREARNAAQLRSHRNIVNVLDVLDVDEQPWIVMELVRGETLAARINKRTRLSVHETATIGKALLDALEAAHTAGIIHRDLKPDNVMLAHDDRVLLADFGIAKNTDDYGITPVGNVFGSFAYLAPERMDGQDVPSGDLFSLGATLYHAVEGKSPFDRDTRTATIKAVLIENPAPPTHAGSLETTILRLLAKEPDQRPDIPETRGLLDSALTAGDTTRSNKPKSKPTAVLEWQSAGTGNNGTPAKKRRGSTKVRAVASIALLLGVLAVLVPVIWHGVRTEYFLFTRDDAAKYLGTPANAVTQGKLPVTPDGGYVALHYQWNPIGSTDRTIEYTLRLHANADTAEREMQLPEGQSATQLPNGSNTIVAPLSGESGCTLQLQHDSAFIEIDFTLGAGVDACAAAGDAAHVIDDRFGQFP